MGLAAVGITWHAHVWHHGNVQSSVKLGLTCVNWHGSTMWALHAADPWHHMTVTWPCCCAGLCRPALHPLPRNQCQERNQRRAGLHKDGQWDQEESCASRPGTKANNWSGQAWHNKGQRKLWMLLVPHNQIAWDWGHIDCRVTGFVEGMCNY